MKLEQDVARRISMLRFILIAVVVFLHIAEPGPIATLDFSNHFEVVRAFTQGQIGRICVPVLTMISAYLLFSANLDQAPAKLYKKKARTLLIPFLIFNVCYVAILACLEYMTGLVAVTSILNAEPMRVVNMFFAVDKKPLNVPLHFLRELFVLVLLAPLFGLLLRRAPLFGLLLVSGFFLLNFDRQLILRNSMAVTFYIGGMAAIGRWDVKRYDRFAVHCCVALLLLCAALMYFRVENRTAIYLAAPLLVWPMASLLQDTGFGNWAESKSKFSFFIFLGHMPLIELVRRMYLQVDDVVPKAVFIYGAPVLIIALLIQIYKMLAYLMPRGFSVAIGGRASERPGPPAPRGDTLAHPTAPPG